MRRFLPLAVAALALAACTVDDGPDDATANTEAAAVCDDALVGALSRWADAGFSGSIAITTDGAATCEAGFGFADAAAAVPNTADTVFAIGSVSKAFTAAAVLDLADSGAFALDDRAGALLPGLGGDAADATVAQLLLHTSGLTGSHGDDHVPLEREAAIAAISSIDAAFAPGSDFGYANAGYTLLALIVDQTTGGYRDHMADRILRLPGGERIGGFWDGDPAPAGTRAIGVVDGERAASLGDFAGPHWAMDGNGDLAVSAPDLAAWAAALFDGGIVGPGAVQALTATAFDHGDGTAEIPGWVALDAADLGVRVYTAAGGGGDTGHDAVVAWLPESRQSLAITANGDAVSAAALLDAIGPALAAGEPVPEPEVVAYDADAAALAAVAGTYETEDGSQLTVTADAGVLRVGTSGEGPAEVLFAAVSGFTAEDVQAHEAAVLALLRGETEPGREELALIEDDLGAVEDVAALTTVAEQGELRTYVRIEADQSVLAWYAVDRHGAVAAVVLDPGPPAATLVRVGDDEYRQERLDGAGLGVRVVFEADLMIATGPTGGFEARRIS